MLRRRMLSPWPLAAVIALSGFSPPSSAPAASAAAGPPPIKHVFTILLENESYDSTFGTSPPPSPYLARTLPSLGQLLTQYYGIGHASLDNYVAMVSGQAPNPQTQGDCQVFTDFAPGVIGADGQAVGQGCVYPTAVKTLPDQLEAAGISWKGYMQDMGNTPSAPRTCRHPPLDGHDETQVARANDQYAGRHNPFIYFHSIIDDQAGCDAHVVPLDDLPGDLASAASTPAYVYITPDLCADGHDATCADGSPGGYAGIDAFLAEWVPRILGSPAFADNGLLIVTFDEADAAAAEACCDEQTGPNAPKPGISGPGGGRTGAVLVSPFIAPGSVNDTPYNHYSYLRSMEDLFGIATGGADNLGHLGYAGRSGLRAFGSDVFNGSPSILPLFGRGAGPLSGARKLTRCLARPLRLARGSRRVLRRGSLISRAKLLPPTRGGRTLELAFRRDARLSVRVRSGRRHRTVRGAVRGCTAYRVRLGYRHGSARVVARFGKRRYERRAIAF